MLALMVNLPSQALRCSVRYKQGQDLPRKLPRKLAFRCLGLEVGYANLLRLAWPAKRVIDTNYHPRAARYWVPRVYLISQ